MTSHVFIQKMHYSLTSGQLYFLVPLSSFPAHLLATSNMVLACNRSSELSTSKWLDCIHVNTWVWPCCHNIQLWTPSVLYLAPADHPIFHVDKITNIKWMISSPLVCLFHPLCHSLLQVFQCSCMCILKLEMMLSYPVCRSHCRRCCATK